MSTIRTRGRLFRSMSLLTLASRRSAQIHTRMTTVDPLVAVLPCGRFIVPPPIDMQISSTDQQDAPEPSVRHELGHGRSPELQMVRTGALNNGGTR
jgi:hypothetical protein